MDGLAQPHAATGDARISEGESWVVEYRVLEKWILARQAREGVAQIGRSMGFAVVVGK
jgi:hypothetical protein